VSDNFQQTAEQAAAFQKIWAESISKVMQTAFTITPNSPPPEIMREMRSGIFRALAQSWEEFMRSPQFLEGMKQWMESAINFRKMTNDFMAKVRNELEAPSRDDIDTIMLSVRHMEKRLLDRIEQLSNQVNHLNGGRGSAPKRGGSRQRGAANGKTKVTRVKPGKAGASHE
jgi:hypothetical protein